MTEPVARPALLMPIAIVAALPLFFLAGAAATGALHALRGPPGSGEGVQADAYTVMFIGGPAGVLVGTIVSGWLAWRLRERLTWPVAVLLLGAVLVGSVLALRIMGSH